MLHLPILLVLLPGLDSVFMLVFGSLMFLICRLDIVNCVSVIHILGYPTLQFTATFVYECCPCS